MTQEERDRLVRAEERGRANTRRIEVLETQQKNMTELMESVSVIAQKQADMDTDLKEIKSEVKTINARPTKRWEAVVEKAVLTAVGVLVAYIALKLGLA